MAVEKDPNETLDISLEKQTITIHSTGETEKFDINPYKKTCLVNGYDDIDYLISIKSDIEAYEKKRGLIPAH
jgi:3-isopropylmalate/(R)-2-methylmalate dehydratase small subunit